MPPTVGEVYLSEGARDKTLVCRGAERLFESLAGAARRSLQLGLCATTNPMACLLEP